MEILLPILIFVGLGLLSGILLSVFSKIFAVKTDERIEAVTAALPGLNCGACGFSGCENYAKNIIENGAQTNRCKPGGDKTSQKLSELLGTDFEDVIETVAFVRCGGKVPAATSDCFEYQGIETCAACNQFYEGKGLCDFGCLGYGDCVKTCLYDAISIKDEIAVIDANKCSGCSMCTKVCPKNLIQVKDATKKVIVACSSCDPGKITMQKCKNGCIGCKKCEKTCPNDAIHVNNNLASIDYDKCTSCEACVAVCPRGCIVIENYNHPDVHLSNEK